MEEGMMVEEQPLMDKKEKEMEEMEDQDMIDKKSKFNYFSVSQDHLKNNITIYKNSLIKISKKRDHNCYINGSFYLFNKFSFIIRNRNPCEKISTLDFSYAK